MNRGIALVVAVVAVVGLVGVAAAGPVGTVVAQDDPATNGTDANGTNETDANDANDANGTDTSADSGGTDPSPGERFSGVVGVQQAEIAGEVSSRSFEVALDRADTDAERAAVVAERLNRTEDQLGSIERRHRELRERRDAGELSQGAFAARMAEVGARAESTRREANQSAAVAEQLPASARAQRGLDEERLNAVRRQASDLSGPEVAAIARGIGGNETGSPLAADRRGPPARRGPSDDVANGTGPDRGQPEAPGRSDAERPAAASGAANASGDAAGRGNGTGVQGPDPGNASLSDRTPGARAEDGPPQNGSARGDDSASDGTSGNEASGGSNPGNGGSDAGPSDRGGSDGDGSAGDGSADGGSGGDGSASDDSASDDSADRGSGGDGSASGGAADGGSGGDGSADRGSGGDGSAGRGSGAENNPGRDRPLLDSLDAAGGFLRSAWSSVAAIGSA